MMFWLIEKRVTRVLLLRATNVLLWEVGQSKSICLNSGFQIYQNSGTSTTVNQEI